MRTLWVAVVIAGCGRIGFDPISAGDGALAIDACQLSPFGQPVPIAELNSNGTDWAPWLSDDRTELVFASDRSGQFELYRSTRSAAVGPFGPPQPIAFGGAEDDPYVTPDGVTLWFDSDLAGGRQIFTATRASPAAPFQSPSRVTELSGTSHDGAPSLSRDGLTLVFDSDRAGGGHLFQATRMTATATFGAPVELTGLGGAGTSQVSPCLAPDGTLFFLAVAGASSQIASAAPGPSGYGAPMTFAPISDGSSNEYDPYVTGDGRTIVFGSDRAGGATQVDLYMVERSCL